MNTLQAISFVHTRSRSTDCDTSKAAAKHAVTGKASRERQQIRATVYASLPGLTAREVATATGIDYIAVQRRIAECGLHKTQFRRDRCAVWVGAMPTATGWVHAFDALPAHLKAGKPA